MTAFVVYHTPNTGPGYFLTGDEAEGLWCAAYQDREFNVVNKVSYYSPNGEVAEPF